MDYELCKKLKEAGFPQTGDYWFDKTYKFELNDGRGCGQEGEQDYFEIAEDYSAPTLSELIEACGEHLVDIVKSSPTHWRVHGQGKIDWDWMYGGRRDWGYSISGKSPEEAVAKLYLAIHSQELKDSKDMID